MPFGVEKVALLGAAGSGEADAGGVFECIAKQTVSGGSTTSVEFTSIPASTYDEIEVIVSWVPATSDSSAGISWAMEMELNGADTNVYGRCWIAGSGRSTDSSLTTTGYLYAAQPNYMGYTQYQNGLFNRQRFPNVNTNTWRLSHTLSGSGVPNQPLGPSGQDSFWYDRYGMQASATGALSSLKFVSEWSRVIEDGTTFTMMGIKSS